MLCVASISSVIRITFAARALWSFLLEDDWEEDAMERLPEVEAARALMTEAVAWSVMKWLREKKRVRKTADKANAALDQLSQALRGRWPDDLRSAYEALVAQAKGSATGAKTPRNNQKSPLPAVDSEALLIAKKLKAADDEAYRARMRAEDTFDEAERKLSTTLAREGCRKAIDGWDLHEKAIRKAEAVLHPK